MLRSDRSLSTGPRHRRAHASGPGRPPARAGRLTAVTAAALLAALGAVGCSSDDGSAGGGDASGRTTTTATSGGHDSHSTGASEDDPYGSHGMEPKVTSVEEIAAIGPGPAPGDTFHGAIGLNVCGRFLDPPPASGAQDGSAASGITTDGKGNYVVTPPDEAAAGHSATVGALLSQAGIELGSGKVTFAPSTTPAQIDVAGSKLSVAGATFDNSTSCGGVPAEVQLWVFTRTSVQTADDVRAVVENPQDTPIVDDEMAFVVAVMPESSLPTLPPSALRD